MSVENENRNMMNNMGSMNNMNNNMSMNMNMNMMSNNMTTATMSANEMMQNNNTQESCESFNETREEMRKKIKCLQFAIIELALYLDTHPDDEKALCLHNKYCKEFKELKDKYQKVYGPLTINYPCNKWRWLEEPWPWEGGMD